MTWWERVQLILYRGLVLEIREMGDKIMGLVEDLRAAQDDQNAKLDILATEVTDIDTEVKDLLTRIVPGGPALTADDVARAQAISARLGVLSDAIKAIPPAPGV